MQQQSLSIPKASYYFSRVKDSYTENGQIIFILFGRLTIKTPEQSLCIWADVKEITLDEANSILKAVPDGIYTYKVQERVFRELERLSQYQQKDLVSLIPLYQTVEFKQLAPVNDSIEWI